MVYSLPVLIFCFINIFNSTWADACNPLLPSIHQGNDENFNNRDIFRSIFFEHALRRESRMVNVCERVGTERLVNNRRIVDSDSRISNFPARDGVNHRIQDSRIVMERYNPNRREQQRRNIRENSNLRKVRTENDRRIVRNGFRSEAGNMQSRLSSDPTTGVRTSRDFQRRNVRERVVRDSRQEERNNRFSRTDVNERDLDIRLDQTVRNSRGDQKDSFVRSRSVRSLPDVSRYSDLDDSIRVVRDSRRISRDLSRQDRSVRISREQVGRDANNVRSRSAENQEASMRMARDSRTDERRDLSKRDRTVRISRGRVDRNTNDVRSRSVEDQETSIRMTRDSRTDERMSRDLTRQVRVGRISRDRVGPNANDVRSRSVENREASMRFHFRDSRSDERISRDLNRQDQMVRISRDRVGRNSNNVRSRSVEDEETLSRMTRDSRTNERMFRAVRISRDRVGRNANDVRSRSVDDQETSIRIVRDSRTDERISRGLIRQDRSVRVSRERNVNGIESRSVEDVRIQNIERVRHDQASNRIRDSQNNERISRDLIRQDRTVAVSRERTSNVEDAIRVRDSRNDERISRGLIRNSRDRNTNEVRSRSVEDVRIRNTETLRNDQASIRTVRNSLNNDRIARDLTRQDRMRRVSRDRVRRNANDVRSRSLEDVRIRNTERIRSNPEVSIRMARDSRNNARIVRNTIRQDRTVRVSREPVRQNAHRDSRDVRNLIRDDHSARLSRSVRSSSMENLRNTRDDARRISNLEASIRTIRLSRENVRLTRSDRDTRVVSRNLEDLHQSARSTRNQNLEASNRRIRENRFINSQNRMERNTRLVRDLQNIRDELQFAIITKKSSQFTSRNPREQKIREITSRIDPDSRRNVQKQQVENTPIETTSQRRSINSPHISQRQNQPQEQNLETRHRDLAMRSINARFAIKDENNNDVDDNSSRSLLLNGKLSTWSNALSTILGILFVAHVLSTSSNAKKSPMKYFSSLFSYQKEKVL